MAHEAWPAGAVQGGVALSCAAAAFAGGWASMVASKQPRHVDVLIVGAGFAGPYMQTIGCKRLCVDTGHCETYNRPNVRLVDVSETSIDEIMATGLTTGGRDHACDAIVLASGFDAMTGTLMRLDLRGRGGMPIQQKWHAGPLNDLGLMFAGVRTCSTWPGPAAARRSRA